MSKAILVIDMPKRCGECPRCASYQSCAFSIREYWCTASDNISVDSDDKPRWCPLKPAPEKIEVSYRSDEQDWDKGYNACIEAIMDN
jgi:hypothetical protein